MAVMGYRLTLLNIERLFGDSSIPYALVTIAVPAGCILLGLTLMQQALAALRSLNGGVGRADVGRAMPLGGGSHPGRGAAVVAARGRPLLGRRQGAGAAPLPSRRRRPHLLEDAGADRLGNRAIHRRGSLCRPEGGRSCLCYPRNHDAVGHRDG